MTSYLSSKSQTFVGLCLIFSFGILHGANDLQLIDRLNERKTTHFVKILIAYSSLVAISVVLFMQIPVIALLIFIIVSAYHFGEQNWNEILKNTNILLKNALQFVYGIVILFAVFYFNAPEVERIIFKIANVSVSESMFLAVFLVAILLYMVVAFLLIVKNRNLVSKIAEHTIYILILCIIFKTASLILGFAIYFIFWHSLPSLYDQIKFLYGSYNLDNFKKYFKSAFVYWVVSLIGVAGLYYIAKDQVIFDALFFSFLASITFPHFIVMLKMFKK